MGARDMLLWVILADRLGRRRWRGLQYSLLPFFFHDNPSEIWFCGIGRSVATSSTFPFASQVLFFYAAAFAVVLWIWSVLNTNIFLSRLLKILYKLKPFIQFKTSVDHNSKNTSFDTYCPLFPDIGEMTAFTGCVTQMWFWLVHFAAEFSHLHLSPGEAFPFLF